MSLKFIGADSDCTGQENDDRSSLRNELRTLLESWGLDLPSDLDDDASLITSGFFDSLALFNLILWVEQKIGRRLDPTSVDLIKEWDSIGSIVAYVRRARGFADVGRSSRPSKVVHPASTSGYRILRYDQSYKRAVASFQTGLWSPDPELNLRYLEWKYESNPYTDKPHIFLAFYRDAIIGMRGFYASLWETGIPSRQFPVLVADDLLVRQDHRNRGLVTRIMQTAYEELRGSGTDFLFNLSGGSLTVLGSLTMGWRSAGLLNPLGHRSFSGVLYRRMRGALRHLPYLGRYARSQLLYHPTERHPFSRLDRLPSRFTKKAELVVEIDTRARPKAMAELIKRLGHDGRLRHVRDERYVDWRFCNPLREYRFLFIGGDKLDGFLVLSRSIGASEPSPQVCISDLEAVNSRVQAALLKAAVSEGGFPELVVWTATANAETQKQLRMLGFGPIDHDRPFSGLRSVLVRPIKDEQLDREWRLGEAQLLDLHNWDIRMLYSMAG
jgi:acyl carrier protein